MSQELPNPLPDVPNLNIPRITLPRNSLAVSETDKLDEARTQKLSLIHECLPKGVSEQSCVSERSEGSNEDRLPSISFLPPINITHDDANVMANSSVRKKRPVNKGFYKELASVSNQSSLLFNVVKAKQDEKARTAKTLEKSSTQAKKRWQASTNKVTSDIRKIKDVQATGKMLTTPEEITVVAINDVEEMGLHDKRHKGESNRGLKGLVNLFNKNSDIQSETPTIFALLRASHPISLAVVTHQAREVQENELTSYEHTLRHFLAFLPDFSIINTLRPRSKGLEEFEGVSMFADVSGFTVLCAAYGTNITKLKDTLNLVMGNIVDEILLGGGDIISFAGDAIFAVWRTHSVEERISILPKIVRCSVAIQDAVNITVDKHITLRVKVGLALGKMFAFNLESACRNHVAVVGPAVKDVNKAEGCCVAGMIVCSQQFFDEFPEKERYPALPIKKPGFVQLWPPKNNVKNQTKELLDGLGNGNHITLDRIKVVKRISDDMVKQDQLKRYIPDYLRFNLEEGQGTSWASQVRTITTLFISLVFADSQKVSTDHCNVQDALTCIDEIVDKMNGTVNKIFTFDKGCTVLVAFGTQGFKMNDDPRRALKTAGMILPSLQNSVTDFQGVSIGVTTGQCFCGVVGHEDRHEYTVIGHQVNLACRLMSNYPFCVAIDESTKKLSTLEDSAFTTLPPKVLKGVPPGGLYFKYSESGEEITEGNYRTHETKEKPTRIVGRAREMDAIYAVMTQVESSEPMKPGQNVIIIEAQAGFGKTKLLDQYGLIGKHRHYQVISVPLVIDEMSTPFFAVKMILYKMLELYRPANAKNKEGVIARYVPEYLRSDMCLLNDLLGTRFNRDSSRDFSFKNLHKLLKVMMKEIVGSWPYLFVIDNSEYMDQNSWEFMSDLSTLKRKTILVLSMRSTARRMTRAEQQVLANPRSKRYILENLTPEEIEEFSKAVLDVKEVPAAVVKVLTEKTRGIPLYCEGLLRKMVKEQIIKLNDDLEAYRDTLPEGGKRRRFSMLSNRSRRTSLSLTVGSTLPGSTLEKQEEEAEDCACTGCFGAIGPHLDSDSESVDTVDRLEISQHSATKTCVLNDSVNLALVALPDSVKELFLAQFDRLSVTEQVTMKCCAVLGIHFSLSLLKAVLPHRSSAQIEHSVRVMVKEKMLECGGNSGFSRCKNTTCSKQYQRTRWQDLEKVPVCDVMRFSTQFSAEILRELLLPEQRIRIHETAARVLEKRILSYSFCCKKEFFGNVYNLSSTEVEASTARGEPRTCPWHDKSSTSNPECQCHEMFTTIYPQIIRHYKAAGTNHSLFEALCSAGALGMALSFTFEAISYLEDALSLKKGRTKLNDRHRACLSSLICLAVYMCPTPTTNRLYKEAMQLGGHAQVIYNVSFLSYLCGTSGHKVAPEPTGFHLIQTTTPRRDSTT